MTSSDEHGREPRGELSIRTFAMPADANHTGDIFGGWLLGQMDIAGGLFASKIARGRTATVAVDGMTFKKPVNVGDVMCVYADLVKIGRTSITGPRRAEGRSSRPSRTLRGAEGEGC